MAPGDLLRFYDPVTMLYLGTGAVSEWPVQLNASADSALGRRADALWETITQPPYHFSSFTKQHYPVQHFRSTAYHVELQTPPPDLSNASALPVPYLVEMERARGRGAVIRNSNFSFSQGLFGRFKSSNSQIEGNRYAIMVLYTWTTLAILAYHTHTHTHTHRERERERATRINTHILAPRFTNTRQEELELMFLPSFYEGAMTLANVSVSGNTFEGTHAHSMQDILAVMRGARNITVSGNVVV